MFAYKRALFLVVSLFGMVAIQNTVAAPKAKLWDRWTSHDASASHTVDHSDWTRLLEKHVMTDRHGLNRIDYAGIIRVDKALLENYIAELSATPVSGLNRAEQFAYWVNLYNAATLKVVVDHYPVNSILDISISPGLFSRGPWGKKFIKVEDENLSLDDIEHRILRPIWRDPRIHYAVNCASVGCPNLQKTAFTPENSERLLTIGAKEYINSNRGGQVSGNGRLNVSSIFHWYKADFGDSDAGVIEHMKQYAQPELLTALNGVSRISDHYYDWDLNDQAIGESVKTSHRPTEPKGSATRVEDLRYILGDIPCGGQDTLAHFRGAARFAIVYLTRGGVTAPPIVNRRRILIDVKS